MVAENSQNTIANAQFLHDNPEAFGHQGVGGMDIVTEVTGHHTKVGINTGDLPAHCQGSIVDIIKMQVGEMQDPVAIESWRQIGKGQSQPGQVELQGAGGGMTAQPCRPDNPVGRGRYLIETTAQAATPMAAPGARLHCLTPLAPVLTQSV